jgi:hypothetical protein
VQTGRAVDISLRLNAVGPDGKPAVFTANASNLVLPQQK